MSSSTDNTAENVSFPFHLDNLQTNRLQIEWTSRTPDVGSQTPTQEQAVPPMWSVRLSTEVSKASAEHLNSTRNGSIASTASPLPTSPSQGARLALHARLPVKPTARPTAVAAGSVLPSAARSGTQSPPAVHVPTSGTLPISTGDKGSVVPVATAMTKDWKYDPNDKTPPRRRMKAIAEEVQAAGAIDVEPSPAGTRDRVPRFTQGPNGEPVMAPASALGAAGSAMANGASDRTLIPVGIEQGQIAGPSVATMATQDHAGTVVSASDSAMDIDEADLSYIEAVTIQRLPYAKAKDLDPCNHLQSKIDAANVIAQLKRLDIEPRRMSKITDRSVSFGATEAGPEDANASAVAASSQIEQHAQQEVVDGTSDTTPRASPSPSYSSAREAQIPVEPDTIPQEQETSDTRPTYPSTVHMVYSGKRTRPPGGSLSLEEPRAKIKTIRGASSLEMRRALDAHAMAPVSISNEDLPTDQERFSSSIYHPAQAVPKNADPRLNANGEAGDLSLQSALGSVWEGRGSLERAGIDPFRDPSPPALAQTQAQDQEKAPSMLPSYSCWKIDWKRILRIGGILLVVLTLSTFLAIALVTMGKTHTYPAVPSDIFTLSSKTITSQDGSSNLTMSWLNGQAVGFQVNPVYNITLDPDEPKPDALKFTFDWSIDTIGMSADERAKKTVSSMPIPSLWQLFVGNVAFVGLSMALGLALERSLWWISDRWHLREDANVYWSRHLLRWFDRTKPAILISALVGSALAWAAISRALLIL